MGTNLRNFDEIQNHGENEVKVTYKNSERFLLIEYTPITESEDVVGGTYGGYDFERYTVTELVDIEIDEIWLLNHEDDLGTDLRFDAKLTKFFADAIYDFELGITRKSA